MYDLSLGEIKKREIDKLTEHSNLRLKFMDMLVKSIPDSEHKEGIAGIYIHLTIPSFKRFKGIFRKEVCTLHLQWDYDHSLGINLYEKNYHKIIKKVLIEYDKIHSSGTGSTIFREYE